MIHAYDEQELSDAMHNLDEAFDFARNVCPVHLAWTVLIDVIGVNVYGYYSR